MKLRTILVGAAATLAVAAFAGAAGATSYVYVGSWAVADGPLWTTNPTVLSGQQTAALLFGGTASEYAISTVDSNPLNINFMAHEDGWGDTTYLSGAVSQSYSLSSIGGGYNNYPSFSAYVFDHACGVYYCDGGGGESAINYAFVAVPEPATWAMMLVGVGGLGAAMRSQRRKQAAAIA
jgi:hypothetical protein